MRVVVQRVDHASVRVDGEIVGSIGMGLLVFAGVREGDDEAEAQRLAVKTAELRIFNDAEGRFNLSLLDPGPHRPSGVPEALVVSQFTLYGNVRKGRRPSFNQAARSEVAEPVIEAYVRALEGLGVRVGQGRFGAHMDVELLNDGPVTIIIDSEDLDRPRRGGHAASDEG